MKNGLVKPQDMRRFSEKIYAEAQRLITLVGDIIRLSQLDEGDSGIERVPVDLYQVISGVADRMKDVAGKNQISIALKGTSATVYGVPQILDEMVSNLCDNAIKYNKPGGYVIMAARIEDGHPVVTVEDNGIGIPKEEQERIFERFYRVDKSHSRQIGGTGLGLSIVKHGAAFHKAQVEMSSILGKGTKVKIIF